MPMPSVASPDRADGGEANEAVASPGTYSQTALVSGFVGALSSPACRQAVGLRSVCGARDTLRTWSQMRSSYMRRMQESPWGVRMVV